LPSGKKEDEKDADKQKFERPGSPGSVGKSQIPRRASHDIGFAEAVEEAVDFVKHETGKTSRGRPRGSQI
jgi:hypothetical protein